MRLRLPFWILLVSMVASCTSVPKNSGDDATRLGIAIKTLSPMVDPAEANRVGQILAAESIRLAEAYATVQPAWLHNVYVNSGLRERGLCYHWVNDLVPILEREGFRSLEFFRAGSALGTFREHHAIVVAPYGASFEEGLFVDSWRKQGLLYWGRVRGDKVAWQELRLKTGEVAKY